MTTMKISLDWLTRHNISQPHIAWNVRDMLPFADILPIHRIHIHRGDFHFECPCKIREFHGVHRISISSTLHQFYGDEFSKICIYPDHLLDDICFIHEEFFFYHYLQAQKDHEVLMKKYDSHPLFQPRVIDELTNVAFQKNISADCKCGKLIKLY